MVSRLRPLILGSLFIGCTFATPAAADETWTGTISDSMCVRKHESGAEGQETTDPDCTRDCVKGGSKYVLVVGERVYKIANQDQADLPKFAGKQNVRITGTLAGDTVTVSKIE